MSSAGNGLTTPLLTKESNSSSRNSVSNQYFLSNTNLFIALPADIVPATFKKKRAAAAPKAKGEEGDDKPGRPTEETARPTGLGRGQAR